MEWAQLVTVFAGLAAVIGLQSLWLARAVDALRGELHRGFGRVEARLDRLDGREPPSLRRA